MRLPQLVIILVLCASARTVESRLHDPEFSRSLAFEGEDLDSITAFSPDFIPAFISAEDGCPPPPSDANCTLEYVPITCNKCPYSHSCLAEAALEDLDTVECLIAPSTPDGPEYGELGLPNDPICPLPDDDAPCTYDFVPLKCNGCIYINSCAAESANFTMGDCVPADETEDSCPLPPADADCPLEYVPTTCNDCPYPNICLAQAAFAGQSDDISCLIAPATPDGPLYGELGLPNDPSCRVPDDDAPCSFDFVPFKCDGCIYINDCAAESANLTIAECTSL
jgi:hypothetical protein